MSGFNDKIPLIKLKKKHLKQQTNCFKISFITKNKFNFICMDSNYSYWHGGQMEKHIFSTRQQCWDSLKFSATFSSRGKLRIAYLEERENRHTSIHLF